MKKSNFFNGIKAGLPICVGYIAVSFAFGMQCSLSGLPFWTAGLMSLTNVTSAGQFAGLKLILEGASFLELISVTLVINMRYFLMSLSLTQKLSGDYTLFHRLSTAFGVTDEIFAVASGTEGDVTPAYMCGLIATPVFGWTLGTVLGALVTNLLPEIISESLGIALYAMFIAIIIPPARGSHPVLFTVITAAALSSGMYYFPYLKEISQGWRIIIATLLTASAAAVLFPVSEQPNEETEVGL